MGCAMACAGKPDYVSPQQRIALIAPAHERVPSVTDGPVGNGIRALADTLTADGHTVLVAAPLPSHCDARLVGTVMHGAETDHVDHVAVHMLRALSAAARFKPDVVHDFSGLAGMFMDNALLETPLVITVYEPLSQLRKEILRSVAEARAASGRPTAFIAQSRWIQQHISGLAWKATIEPAVAVRDAIFNATKQPFALYTGPATAESGILRVVQAAQLLQLPLRIIHRQPHPVEDAFLANNLSTYLQSGVEIVAALDALNERRLLADARVLITTAQTQARVPHMTVRALASGTPVLEIEGAELDSLSRLSSSAQSAVEVIHRVSLAQLGRTTYAAIEATDPYECRRIAAVMFGPQIAANSYVEIYRSLASAELSVVDLRESVKT
jgi:hypothetical protein